MLVVPCAAVVSEFFVLSAFPLFGNCALLDEEFVPVDDVLCWADIFANTSENLAPLGFAFVSPYEAELVFIDG